MPGAEKSGHHESECHLLAGNIVHDGVEVRSFSLAIKDVIHCKNRRLQQIYACQWSRPTIFSHDQMSRKSPFVCLQGLRRAGVTFVG